MTITDIIQYLATVPKWVTIGGPIIGFSIFMIGTLTMEGVYFRPDINNQPHFSLESLGDFMKAPFAYPSEKFNTVWTLYPGLSVVDRMKLLQLNWVVTTVAGTVGTIGVYQLLSYLS